MQSINQFNPKASKYPINQVRGPWINLLIDSKADLHMDQSSVGNIVVVDLVLHTPIIVPVKVANVNHVTHSPALTVVIIVVRVIITSWNYDYSAWPSGRVLNKLN